ncbi:VanW family protein [Bacillus coahuilensis]|uniref:VanW family protein n=1 Tax=Bacillus coahuilensis TaxID=408580 RepID=UPI001F4C97CC|nr:VanW family protein [Bacillus coahuilensis]
MFLIFLVMNAHSMPLNKVELYDKNEVITSLSSNDFLLLDIFVDEKKLEETLDHIHDLTYVPAVNAAFDENGQIQEEQTGKEINRRKLKSVLIEAIYTHSSRRITIPYQQVYPRVDSELLLRLHEKYISHYETYFNPHNLSRKQNILLASQALNNQVIFPGEHFSFNEAVGKRTKQKGYLPAPVIIRGKIYTGIGGGICQVSSTLFNSVDLAGMEIIERYSHSRRVPYVPPKRDATVSWDGPDFIFKNSTRQPILIQAKVTSGTLRITIYSSEDFQLDSH